MFKIVAKPTFEAVVKVPMAGEEPGDLRLVFKHKTRKEVDEYFEYVKSSADRDGLVLSQIVEGWKDVDTEFSVEALETVCQNYHGVITAIFDTYLSELNKAREKN
ncbi:phage tail assembly chaperone [Alcaligenaceae bacterium B3P038]|nr:phage tail assembly chaperone [Alcaligenaceae bacterium B3P038]